MFVCLTYREGLQHAVVHKIDIPAHAYLSQQFGLYKLVDPATKEVLRYREALWYGFEQLSERPLSTGTDSNAQAGGRSGRSLNGRSRVNGKDHPSR